MRINSGRLIVVAPAAFDIPIPGKKQVTHVTNINRVFPAIHELQPGSIVLDYDFMGQDTEKVLRRMAGNPFYQKIKIYCYKSRAHTREDSLLKVLGVQYFIYGEDAKPAKQINTVEKLSNMLEEAVVNTLVDASY